MIWQDIVLMISIFGLGFALIPAVLHKSKPARLTCLLTALLLLVITICFVTLRLWLSTVAEAFAVAMWFILLFQRRK